LSERYNQQDGAPETRRDSAETVEEHGEESTATIGERSTVEKVAGQGLGQMKGDEPGHRAPRDEK
jgi:hypothetical protein